MKLLLNRLCSEGKMHYEVWLQNFDNSLQIDATVEPTSYTCCNAEVLYWCNLPKVLIIKVRVINKKRIGQQHCCD